MSVPVDSAHRPSGVFGRLSLRFEAVGGRTLLRACEQRPPLRVVRAFPIAEGGALVHLHNVSGGVLGGDRLELRVEAGPRTCAQITSTGATRIYRSRAGKTAFQQTEVSVGAEALLEYLPDPLIPFAGARYRQEIRIDLEEDAGLLWWDVLAPGREAYDEVFAYELLQSSLSITARGCPIALERYCLEPLLRPLTSPARLGAYRYLATFYICRVGVAPGRWLTLEAQFGALAQQLSLPDRTLWGVSALPAHGLIVRGLARAGRELTSGLLEFWRASRLALYGRDTVPPRKVY